MHAWIILGNQLFAPPSLSSNNKSPKGMIFIREDRELCTYFRFHKHKIIFFLAAMRTYAQELQKNGFQVHYEKLKPADSQTYEQSLLQFLTKNKVSKVSLFEIEDKFFEKRILSALEKAKVEVTVHPSPMFLTSRDDFKKYSKSTRRPFMKVFYEQQRKKHKILMKGNLPEGGQFSFDADNRKALPANITPAKLPQPKVSTITAEVQKLVDSVFPDHPGTSESFWLPVDRPGAIQWLQSFLEERFENFGPYEDALTARSQFVFHSVLTPFLNVGLLEPQVVLDLTLKHAIQKKVPLQSTEGFVRQILGWREFIRGVYQEYSEEQDSKNFFSHKKSLTSVWYKGQSGVPVLDRALDRVQKNGYLHHIERLMVIGNFMLLLEVDPKAAHRWFMEMFIDSSDWVMGPNVYGMALFSDGGIFATKPYICGSNYYLKMGDDKKGPWCDAVDGLYWSFLEKHRALLSKNPRMTMIMKGLDRMTPERKKKITAAAQELREKLVQ
jgi:deoxyribodipyrimidine photolyase-related protein